MDYYKYNILEYFDIPYSFGDIKCTVLKEKCNNNYMVLAIQHSVNINNKKYELDSYIIEYGYFISSYSYQNVALTKLRFDYNNKSINELEDIIKDFRFRLDEYCKYKI